MDNLGKHRDIKFVKTEAKWNYLVSEFFLKVIWQ